MREAEFLNQLYLLLDSEVAGLTGSDPVRLARDVAEETLRMRERGRPVTCRVVPFMTGRRPTDEAAHPGLGSSDNTSMIVPPGPTARNRTYVLYAVGGLENAAPEELADVALDVTLSFCGTDGSLATAPIPGWNRRPLAPAVFERGPDGPAIREIPLAQASGRRLVLELDPEALLPGPWRWEELDPAVRAGATDADDPFTLGHMFTQMVEVQIRATRRGVPLASAAAWIDACDTRRFGSLYRRILERVVVPDTGRQARSAGRAGLDPAYHPWFPVLLIGSDKAALYMRALVEDVVQKKRHLTDARWLMRIGLYLEMLTCLAIFEVVKDDVGDLLSPAERAAFESSPFFAEIRRRLNPEGWRRVWALRHIAFPAFGVPEAGPVSATNLLQKKKATLAFLEVHHQDLKHAIELAGPNLHNSQETWHRVFRDAERAVLRKTPDAFPELAQLPESVRAFVLWHRAGHVELPGLRWMSNPLSTLFGDQDGLFASACNQYRESMNEVAAWARGRGLMDYTGDECVPTMVSLLAAYMNGNDALLARLQKRDGYAGRIEVEAELPEEMKSAVDDVAGLVAEAPVFEALSDEERLRLASNARRIVLGPMERIVVQGREGSSLFLVAEGRLEALVRQDDGRDLLVDVNKRGDVIGEISFLTGAPRTATVRALEGGVVYEIGKSDFQKIVQARPQIVDDLEAMMAKHVENVRRHRERYEAWPDAPSLGARLRRFLFAGGPEAGEPPR